MDPKQALPNSQDSAPVPDDQNGVNDQVPPPGDGEPNNPPEPQLPQEAVDEDGVPYRNRIAEKDRKLRDTEARLKAYEDMLSKQQAPPTQAQKDEFDDLLEQVDPASREFMKNLRTRMEKSLESKVLGTLNKTLKAQSEQRVISAHPEILDPNSELGRQVNLWTETMRRMGANPDQIPNWYETLVETITKTAPKNGQPKPKPNNQPIPQGGNNFFAKGTPPSKPQDDGKKMPEGTAKLAAAMGLGEKSLKRLDQRYKQGDFDLTGGGK